MEGFRTVALPQVLVPEVSWHLAKYVAGDPEALVFTGAKGRWFPGQLAPGGEVVSAARQGRTLRRFHFHDLRHIGNLAPLSEETTRR